MGQTIAQYFIGIVILALGAGILTIAKMAKDHLKQITKIIDEKVALVDGYLNKYFGKSISADDLNTLIKWGISAAEKWGAENGFEGSKKKEYALNFINHELQAMNLKSVDITLVDTLLEAVFPTVKKTVEDMFSSDKISEQKKKDETQAALQKIIDNSVKIIEEQQKATQDAQAKLNLLNTGSIDNNSTPTNSTPTSTTPTK